MSLSLVLEALREPESFARRWALERRAPFTLLASLAATASVGVGAYGAAMHISEDALAAGQGGAAAILAAGIAWTASLPSLYVLGSLRGSRLTLQSLALATLVTVSFGGVAMLASIPVLWFFELCLPYSAARLFINAVVFLGVGASMSDVFIRVMAGLEGRRLLHFAWLGLLGMLGAEMFYVVGLFDL
jgi:hypothetical protein